MNQYMAGGEGLPIFFALYEIADSIYAILSNRQSKGDDKRDRMLQKDGVSPRDRALFAEGMKEVSMPRIGFLSFYANYKRNRRLEQIALESVLYVRGPNDTFYNDQWKQMQSTVKPFPLR